MNRTVGIGLTIFTVLCCACPGLVFCILGVLAAVGVSVPVTTTLGSTSSTQNLPASWGIGFICLSIILIAIPIVVGFVTLRNKPAAVDSPVVPPT